MKKPGAIATGFHLIGFTSLSYVFIGVGGLS
jgi:hypothetical protein